LLLATFVSSLEHGYLRVPYFFISGTKEQNYEYPDAALVRSGNRYSSLQVTDRLVITNKDRLHKKAEKKFRLPSPRVGEGLGVRGQRVMLASTLPFDSVCLTGSKFKLKRVT
jgi:hypothetical protein